MNGQDDPYKETTAVINSVVARKSKGGKDFFSVATDNGFFTCWDKDAEQLKVNGVYNLTYAEKDGFKSIKNWEFIEDLKDTPVRAAPSNKDAEIRASVALKAAVDLCCAGWIELARIEDVTMTFVSILKKSSTEGDGK